MSMNDCRVHLGHKFTRSTQCYQCTNQFRWSCCQTCNTGSSGQCQLKKMYNQLEPIMNTSSATM